MQQNFDDQREEPMAMVIPEVQEPRESLIDLEEGLQVLQQIEKSLQGSRQKKSDLSDIRSDQIKSLIFNKLKNLGKSL